MLSKGRVTAPALVTLAALAAMASLAVTGCASRGGTAASVGAPGASGTNQPPVELTGATLVSDGNAPRLLLSGSGPLSPSVFSREDGKRVVVDLPNTVAAAGLEPPRPIRGETSLVSHVEMRSFSELGRPHVQLELLGAAPFAPRMEAGANASGAMEIVLVRKATAAAPPVVVASAVPPAEPAPSAISAVAEKTAAETPATAPPGQPPAPEKQNFTRREASGPPAARLHGVSARKKGGDLVVQLAGNGEFGYEAFLLANPPRWVVDLPGVKNEVAVKSRDISGGPVTRVRISQFRNEPAAVTRVVFDLVESAVPELRQGSAGLAVAFHTAPAFTPAASVAAASAPSSAAAPASPRPDAPEPPPPTIVTINRDAGPVPGAGSYEAHEAEDQAEKVVAESAAVAQVATIAEKPAGKPGDRAVEEVAAEPVEKTAEKTVEKTERPAPRPETPIQVAAVAASSALPSEKPAAAPAPAAVKAPLAAKPTIAPEVVAATAEIRVAPRPPDQRRPAPARARKPSATDRAQVEAAEALLLQQEAGSATKNLGNAYEAKVMGAGEKQYTGEPITLNLKDADIKDTLQKFSELTGLNIVLDPEVRGSVTVSLADIPWDQALELILKINGLGYTLEGNVMRIAPTGKLSGEETAKRALQQAQEQNRPLKTIIQKLSYAQGPRMVEAIKKVMSPRGDVYVEIRSNNLIIKELPENLPVILDLIKNLDTPPMQVMIEARIVEATRTFAKSLGVNWSFTGLADTAHGNTTGLVFPNNVNVGGQVSLPSGTNLLNLALGNVLDTFKLDFALSAAENRGLVKLISSPKIVTTQGQTATIQSGFQIPVQTTVNNTTSVMYIDATTNLNVVPMITAEGTIIMDISIQRREPAPGVNIAAGTNVPLVTRDAKTQLLVRDGGTAVIGGIMKLSTNNARNMIPGLWKIPIIGNLFKNNSDSEQNDELIIFITPRIVKNI